MSSSPFRPFGLIQTRLQERLYQKAHVANIRAGLADPKENETVALMEVLFSQNIFADRNAFVVNSQQPPSPASALPFAFDECKRASTRTPYSLMALEEQAREYCAAHLEYYTDKVFVYAATMARAHIRLWQYERGKPRLRPMWGSDARGDWQQYKDVGSDQDVQTFEQNFTRMRSFPPSRRADGADRYEASSSTAASNSSNLALGGWGSTNPIYEAPGTYFQQPSSFTTNAAQGSSSSGAYPGPSTYVTASHYQQQAMMPAPVVLESSKPTLTTNAVEIRVSYEKHQHRTKPDEYKYWFTYGNKDYVVPDHEWRQETVLRNGELCIVHAYTGKRSGTTFWTPTLDPTTLNEHQSHRRR